MNKTELNFSVRNVYCPFFVVNHCPNYCRWLKENLIQNSKCKVLQAEVRFLAGFRICKNFNCKAQTHKLQGDSRCSGATNGTCNGRQVPKLIRFSLETKIPTFIQKIV